MRRKKINCIGLLVAIFFSCQVALFAADIPSVITVGLESVYKDVSQIEFKSNTPMKVGYFNNGLFEGQGILPSNNIIVTRAKDNYYTDDASYITLEEAQQAVKNNESGIVAYIEPNHYKVYTLIKGENTALVSPNKLRILVKDSNDSDILVSENSFSPLMFQGTDSAYSYPVTGVGGTKKYRGVVGVVNGQNSGLTAINNVDIEEYLYGVIPGEMVASWPLEALKAQAVAARSLAAFQYNRYIQKGYNVVDTTATQVYLGATREQQSTNLAVDETRGQIATYNGKLAETVYFSTSGGYTEDAKNVWGNDVPYLKATGDTYENNPEIGPWDRTITLGELDKCLAKQNANIGSALGIEIIERTSSGRVGSLKVLGTNGEYVVKNENTRTFFSGTSKGSLRSRMYGFSPVANIPVPSTSQNIYILSKDANTIKQMNTLQIIGASGNTVLKDNVALQSATETVDKPLGNITHETNEKTVVYGDFTVYGKGFGHGVGMSQSGAMGMAKAGYNYEEILEYYYQGIQIER